MNIKIKVTIPDLKKFQSAEFVKRIQDAQRRKTGPELKALFQKTVEGWDHKPTFAAYYTTTPSSISVRVSTVSGIMGNAGIYALVSKGSPPHIIRPHGSFLRFQVGYRAATRPGIIGSQRKQRSGAFVKAKVVNHPGFEGREFDEAIADEYAPTFVDDMNEAMKP